jgi:alpha-N-arabinofuranosidase
MVSLKLTALAAVQVLYALALDVKVSSSGGNATSGHQYGFLFEVSLCSLRTVFYVSLCMQ